MQAQDILPDDVNTREFRGVAVRKGTVAAFLGNAAAWLSQPEGSVERDDAERELLAALPALDALELFTLLMPRDERLRALLGVR